MKSIFMKLFIIGLCVSFFPIQAIAQGQTGSHAINWVYQRDCDAGQGFEVRLATAHANPDGCSNAFVLELSCDERWYLPSVAVFLTAFAQGKTVEAFVNGCDFEGHAIVRAVQANF